MWPRRSKHRQLDPAELEWAKEAKARAEGELELVRLRWPEVNRISTTAVVLGQRNHFGESIELAFKRRRAT